MVSSARILTKVSSLLFFLFLLSGKPVELFPLSHPKKIYVCGLSHRDIHRISYKLSLGLILGAPHRIAIQDGRQTAEKVHLNATIREVMGSNSAPFTDFLYTTASTATIILGIRNVKFINPCFYNMRCLVMFFTSNYRGNGFRWD